MQFTFTVDEKVASTPEFYRKYADFLESLHEAPTITPLLERKAPTVSTAREAPMQMSDTKVDPVLEILKEATPFIRNLAEEFETPEIIVIWDKFLQALDDSSKKPRFDLASFVKDYLTSITPQLIACGFFAKVTSLAISNPAMFAALAKSFTDYFF